MTKKILLCLLLSGKGYAQNSMDSFSKDADIKYISEHPELQEKFEGFNREYTALRAKNSTGVQKQEMVERFVGDNLDNRVGAYVFCTCLFAEDPARLDSFYGLFPQELQASSSSLQMMKKQLDVQRSIFPGHTLRLFLSTTMDGKIFSPESLRGKYAVLDFWGSWCKPCLAGFAKMKEYYSRFRDRIEFVGIDCRETDDRGKNIVREQELDWTQLTDTSLVLVKQFMVYQFPTKILVGPEGKIMQIFKGENDDFYSRLDELFSKTKQ